MTTPTFYEIETYKGIAIQASQVKTRGSFRLEMRAGIYDGDAFVPKTAPIIRVFPQYAGLLNLASDIVPEIRSRIDKL